MDYQRSFNISFTAKYKIFNNWKNAMLSNRIVTAGNNIKKKKEFILVGMKYTRVIKQMVVRLNSKGKRCILWIACPAMAVIREGLLWWKQKQKIMEAMIQQL